MKVYASAMKRSSKQQIIDKMKKKVLFLLSALVLVGACGKNGIDASDFAPPPCPIDVADGKFVFVKSFGVIATGTVNGIPVDTLNWDSSGTAATITMQGTTGMTFTTGTTKANPYFYIDTLGKSANNNVVSFFYDGVHTVSIGRFQYTVTGTYDTCTWPHPYYYLLTRHSGDTVFNLGISRVSVTY